MVLVQLVAELALHRMEKSRFAKCWSGEGGGEIAEILQQRDEKTGQLPDLIQLRTLGQWKRNVTAFRCATWHNSTILVIYYLGTQL